MSTRPSLILSATLPVKPSHTMTSASPLYTSRASTLPMNSTGESLRSRYASRVSSFPFVASSPIDSRPTRGERIPSPMCAYTLPITPNCLRCCGRHSTLAPTSSSTAEPRFVGTVTASAGRSTPAIMPNAACAAITVAPVWPALKSAAASPRATRSAATLMLAVGFLRSADAGESSIAITSGASTTRTRSRVISGYRASSSSSFAVGPTSVTPRSKWRAAAKAPSTIWRGAKSPPMASTAIQIIGLQGFPRFAGFLEVLEVPGGLETRLDRGGTLGTRGTSRTLGTSNPRQPLAPGVRGSTRSWRTRGAAASARGSAGTRSARPP